MRARVPELRARDVHVWRLDLAGGAPSGASRDLAQEDLDRAARFAFDRDRYRYLRSRLGVRAILAAYLGLAPAAVPIAIGVNGKPRLEMPDAPGFSLSHSGDHGLLAVGRAQHIGVDIEVVDRSRDVADLAPSVFCRAELEAFGRAGAEARFEAFFTGWTRKEACLKAFGTGLSMDPRLIDAGVDAERRRIESPWGAERHLEIASIIREPGAVAALAVGGGFDDARVEDWTLQ